MKKIGKKSKGIMHERMIMESNETMH